MDKDVRHYLGYFVDKHIGSMYSVVLLTDDNYHDIVYREYIYLRIPDKNSAEVLCEQLNANYKYLVNSLVNKSK